MGGAPDDRIPASREFNVDGRLVRVFDGLLPNVAQYVQALAGAAFTRTEVARPETAEYKHWVTEVKLEVLARQPILGITQDAVRGFTGTGESYRPYRAYTNVATYGDMLFSHTDCQPGAQELTALWYLCERWDLEWGGETLFFDAAAEVAGAVLPKPGRLVVFEGEIRHVGRAPNRICYAPRYTFAIKLERAP